MGKKLNRAIRKEGKKLAGQAGKALQSSAIKVANVTQGVAKMALKQVGRSIKNQIKSELGMGIMGRGAYMVGRGSYAVAAPSGSKFNDTFTHASKGTITKITADGTGVVICGKELVTKVLSTGSAAYSCTGFSCNPGLRAVFPWLSQIAPNFAEYEMGQLIFEYEPVISPMSVSSVGSLGNVILGVQYNAGSPNFPSFQAITSSDHCAKGNIAESIFCGIECDPQQNANKSNLYVRPSAVPAGQDIKTYDLAKFQLALDGVPPEYTTGTALGNLWVHYTVKLSKKLFYDGLGYNITSDSFCLGSGQTANLPLGSTWRANSQNNIGGELTPNTVTQYGDTGQWYTFPDDFVGTVEVGLYVTASSGLTGVGVDVPTITGGTVTQPLSYAYNPTTTVNTIEAGTGSNQLRVRILDIPTAAALPGANKICLKTTGAVPNGTYFWVKMINPVVVNQQNNWVLGP